MAASIDAKTPFMLRACVAGGRVVAQVMSMLALPWKLLAERLDVASLDALHDQPDSVLRDVGIGREELQREREGLDAFRHRYPF